MATQSIEQPTTEPVAEHEWNGKRPEVRGDYAREVDQWRIGAHQVSPCGQCGTPVLAGLVCRRVMCVEARQSGPYTDATWQVAA